MSFIKGSGTWGRTQFHAFLIYHEVSVYNYEKRHELGEYYDEFFFPGITLFRVFLILGQQYIRIYSVRLFLLQYSSQSTYTKVLLYIRIKYLVSALQQL